MQISSEDKKCKDEVIQKKKNDIIPISSNSQNSSRESQDHNSNSQRLEGGVEQIAINSSESVKKSISEILSKQR